MKKTERLEEAVAPDGTVLGLYRHDNAYYIRANGIELMSTRRHHSEEALADEACRAVRNTSRASVLIGGLGFGFTLTAALRILRPDARIVVAEIMDEVIEWNRNPAYALAGAALADPRVTLRRDDVANVLMRSKGMFDAVLLDVDNGAESFTTAGNARLYESAGIELGVAALKPGGRLAYWSATDDPDFQCALENAGLIVQTKTVRAHVTSGPWHTLFIARQATSR